MLDPFSQLFQHCWGHARSLRMVYKDLWVVSFPRWTAGLNIVGSCCIRLHTTANSHATTVNIVDATMLGVVASVCTPLPTHTQQLSTLLTQQCWELLRLFAHHCQLARNNSQHCWRNNFGSCCVCLHAVDATMLGVVASVCTQPKMQNLPATTLDVSPAFELLIFSAKFTNDCSSLKPLKILRSSCDAISSHMRATLSIASSCLIKGLVLSQLLVNSSSRPWLWYSLGTNGNRPFSIHQNSYWRKIV